VGKEALQEEDLHRLVHMVQDGASNETDSSLPPLAKTELNLLPTAMASSLAGLLARFPLHPLDTCKAKMQVHLSSAHTDSPSARSVFRQTFHCEGIRGLYRGFVITALGSVPAGCLYFSSYEFFKHQMLHWGPAGQFLAGLGAETVSCLLWVPIDVCKENVPIVRLFA
jgi:hypothetical protein